ncbi:hypothetical protein M0802_012419 [Mischocyttarus mexicanus]|nr:hypothetical protein M0802_012419 [Mischocyttarus mexicanus]
MDRSVGRREKGLKRTRNSSSSSSSMSSSRTNSNITSTDTDQNEIAGEDVQKRKRGERVRLADFPAPTPVSKQLVCRITSSS